MGPSLCKACSLPSQWSLPNLILLLHCWPQSSAPLHSIYYSSGKNFSNSSRLKFSFLPQDGVVLNTKWEPGVFWEPWALLQARHQPGFPSLRWPGRGGSAMMPAYPCLVSCLQLPHLHLRKKGKNDAKISYAEFQQVRFFLYLHDKLCWPRSLISPSYYNY